MLRSSSYVYQCAINKNDGFIANSAVFILKKQDLAALKKMAKSQF